VDRVEVVDFAAVFEASPNPYMLLDRELRYVAANQAYLEATGSHLVDLLGRNIFDVFPHDPHDPENQNARRLRASLEGVLATGKADVLPLIPYRITRRRGGEEVEEELTWSATHTPIRGEDGEVRFVLQHTVDVTDLQARRAAFRDEAGVLGRARIAQDSLRDLQQVFEQAPGFMCVVRGPDHVFELANAAYRRLVGDRPLIGRMVRAAVPEVAGQGFYELLDRVLAERRPHVGRATRVELEQRPGLREERFLDFIYQPLLDDRGRGVGIFVQGNDVTAHHRAASDLRRLAQVLDATRDFVGIADPDGRPIFCNTAGLRLIGLPRERLRAISFWECFVERERARIIEEVVPAAIAEGYWEGELHFRHFETGEELPVLYSLFPLRTADGRVDALATITRDLRLQKAADAERARLLRNEQAARAEAERASRVKDEFLALVSHELRTPLTSMLGWVQLLRTGALSPEKVAKAHDTIERNARAQAQLVDDLLDVGRILSGKLALVVEPTDVASTVTAAVETARPAAQAKRVRLEVDLASTGVVAGDPRRLQQVVDNLLHNAVKFTPEGGRVRVAVRREGERVAVEVSDTGVGITPEFLPHVFERFRQAETGAARQLGGLGLGLSIARHIVEAHGGEVQAASEGPGRGATFTVRLPLAPAGTRLGADPGLREGDGLQGVHVLLVDDERDTREVVRELLQRHHARVTEAASADEALDLLSTARPDVIVSDIAMPGQDGYALIRRVRALPEAEGGVTPAVALTAFARVEDRTRAMLAGFQNHVAKPVDPAELVAALGALRRR
jgi:PAS domain S-box-containing protein